MNRSAFVAMSCIAFINVLSCAPTPFDEEMSVSETTSTSEDFDYLVDRFADVQVIRFQVPGFEDLSPQQRQLIYYLSMAGLAGRDIIFDQNFKHNLRIRRTLEAIVDAFGGDRTSEEFAQFMDYTKMVWFSNGIHHFYSREKLIPEFSTEYFAELVASSPEGHFPLLEGETIADLVSVLTPIIFDPEIAPKQVNLAAGEDLIQASATNYYAEDLTQAEVEAFYAERIDPEDPRPISWGLNSKMVKKKPQADPPPPTKDPAAE